MGRRKAIENNIKSTAIGVKASTSARCHRRRLPLQSAVRLILLLIFVIHLIIVLIRFVLRVRNSACFVFLAFISIVIDCFGVELANFLVTVKINGTMTR